MSVIRVLLVEDSVFESALFKMALSKWEKPVTLNTAKDEVQALKILKTGTLLPNLILLDLNLPKRQEVNFIGALREDERCRDIPVVLFPNPHDHMDFEDGDGYQGCMCVKKPADFEEFQAVIFNLQDMVSLVSYS